MHRLVLFLSFCSLIVSANPLEKWTWRNPLPAGIPMHAVSYGDGKFVAVGYAGTAIVSEDGTNWVARQTSIIGEERLSSIAHGNGRFVAVAPHSIVTSTDTTNWFRVSPPTGSVLGTVTFGNGLFVAAGDNATILTSTNGTNWVKRHEQTGLNGSAALAYGHGRFLAAWPSSGLILTSNDGLSWVPGATTGLGFHGLAFGNGLFVGINRYDPGLGAPLRLLFSTNGANWTEAITSRPVFAPVGSLIHDQTRFITTGFGASGSNVVHTSADGQNWSATHWAKWPGFSGG
jgi:hypothetical protein